MELLNDDCLEEIFKHLNTEEQIANIAVCTRFEVILRGMWRRRTASILRCHMFDQLKIDTKKFEKYLFEVQFNLKKAEFIQLSERNIESLKKYYFPQVLELSCCTEFSEEPSDRLTKTLAICFPHLTKLYIESSITGKYISSLKSLTDLKLKCSNLEPKYCSSIFKNLKLKRFEATNGCLRLRKALRHLKKCVTLEEIVMNEYYLYDIVHVLPTLVNLRKITSYIGWDADYILKHLAFYFGKEMKTIIINNSIWPRIPVLCILPNMYNLEKLSLYYYELEESEMKELAQKLSNLRELYYNRCRINTEYGLLHFVKYCKHLEVLNVSETTISKTFINALNNFLRTTYRPKPLKVYCARTPINKYTIEKIEDLSPMLQISFTYIKQELTEPAMYCEWEPDVQEDELT
ncbi:uncharacterized protein LOC119674494 [Teleopsis dalmanni]|uniref:uncharacterized protein LOC119674494 n=1 Tax=Teleopsis dalmanni TaxID=139649 RepID=UPI0018CD3A37|nr:uncharacterized protein LOC119674494 [Teleopsis dalmanni]XP_037941570.1 uncharacterized protein LOC119674494 [Teleopsis dalmanni]XP_037941578.1 uncharacterized protein LOC119674494 [Teleopsis dalmanni]XP_037941584.1 uncharacterized protein LOC119674494 [Teleopsis dalmanni]XP_037941591.1 uncharacterized protein LOC119674494 [Teleopsis dalmanni]